MSNKILNPVVLIHKRENSDSYAVAITSGSQDYHDAVLMAVMEPDMTGDDIDIWSKTGYDIAAEIGRLREKLKQASYYIAAEIERLRENKRRAAMTDEHVNQYAERDAMQLDKNGGYYSRHIQAITREGLHSKSDIAAELAWRDQQIDQLKADLHKHHNYQESHGGK